jgi:ubiquitin-conjugating enzyme E2 M
LKCMYWQRAKNNNIDLAELDIPDTIKLEFPNPSDILNFNVTIHPDEGI